MHDVTRHRKLAVDSTSTSLQAKLYDSEVYAMSYEIAIIANQTGDRRRLGESSLDFTVSYDENRNWQCKEGYVGLLCRLCDRDRGFVRQFRKCDQCEKGETNRARVLLFVSIVLVLTFAAVLLLKYPTRTMGFLNERNMPFKIFIGFIQVTTTIPDNFRLVYPPLVLDFFNFMQYLDIFDVFTFTANFRCIMVRVGLEVNDQLDLIGVCFQI
jgi:hypothetical protein